MKATLIARPSKIEEQPDHTKLLVEYTYTKPPALPKGVPAVPTTPTPYIVYIGGKQWRKVKDALSDPEDNLIIEGYVAYDRTTKAMTLYAQNCTSVKLQRAVREQQAASGQQAASTQQTAPTDNTPATS